MPSLLTVSIWGLIYILLVVFTVYQGRGLIGAARADEEVLTAVGPWFLLAGAANAGGIFAFHNRRIPISELLIMLLLMSLLIAYLRLGVGARAADRVVKWTVFLPFSVYLGCMIVATVANTTALYVDLGWGRFGLSESFWTIVVIAAAGAGLVILVDLIIVAVRRRPYVPA